MASGQQGQQEGNKKNAGSSQELLPRPLPGLEFVDPDEIPLEVYQWMPQRRPAPRPLGMTQWENSQPAPKPWSKAAHGQRDSYDEGDDSAFFPPSTSRASPQEEDVVFLGEYRAEKKNSLDDPEFMKAVQQMEEEEKAKESREK